MIQIYDLIDKARKSGKIEKGSNEATKSAERGTAKLIVYAKDVEPKEIVMHLPVLCKEKNIPCFEVDSKKKLGAVAGLSISCAAIAVLDAGDAENDIASLKK
jgi:large subunit ribosomal protein L7Ae